MRSKIDATIGRRAKQRTFRAASLARSLLLGRRAETIERRPKDRVARFISQKVTIARPLAFTAPQC